MNPHKLLIIVNKYGSLIYSKSFQKEYKANDFILLASTFHSMHSISSQCTPQCLLPKEIELKTQLLDGFTEIVASTFVLKLL